TDTFVLPGVTPLIIGASGTPAGTTWFEAGEGLLSPTSLVATTVHVYVLLVVSVGTVIGDAPPDAAPGAPLSLEVHDAVYFVIVLPLSAGGVKDTTADMFAAVAVGAVGASGMFAGTTESDNGESAPSPSTLWAWT